MPDAVLRFGCTINLIPNYLFFEMTVDAMMLINTPNLFFDELNPGERILWSGQPQQGFVLRPGDVFMIPFSLMWGGFAFFWEFGVVSSGAPFFFSVWGIPFVLVGLYMIVGRFFFDIAQRQKTFYALTNERVIILSGLISQNTKSLQIEKLPEINISTRNNGTGTITFGASHPMSWIYSGSGFPNMGLYASAPSFEMIADARMVYQQIKQMQRDGQRA